MGNGSSSDRNGGSDRNRGGKGYDAEGSMGKAAFDHDRRDAESIARMLSDKAILSAYQKSREPEYFKSAKDSDEAARLANNCNVLKKEYNRRFKQV